ncbi:MAG: LTA synthase family protein [Azonexus sp.]|uniref:LTA synthase family protein n=1 Tax=Azonexus sp. TaxID=1872668 RepID=UPI00282C7707|nr:LTA synthase family protein [Azonexus sp.]MDR0777544.1 LTA synthase family protein [Azonexus sp.]
MPAIKHVFLGGAIFFALPLLFLWAYARWVHIPVATFALHLQIIFWFWIGFIGIRLLLDLLPAKEVFKRIASSLMVVAVFFGFIALYAGILGGIKFWGRPASVQIISTYFWQLPEMLRVLEYSPTGVALVVSMIFLLAVGTAYLFLLHHDWVPAICQWLSTITVFASAIGLIGISVSLLLSLQDRGWGGSLEPLSLVLFPDQAEWQRQNHKTDAAHAFNLRQQHEIARNAYIPEKNIRKSNVIFIVSDSLRADHLSLLGYERKTTPYLEQDRKRGLVRLATSAEAVCSESSCGFGALASSQILANQIDYPFSLQEVLKLNGYKVHLIFSGDHKNFYGLLTVYGQVDSYFDGGMQKNRFANDDRLILDHLDTLKYWDGTPTLLQFVLMSSHYIGTRFEEAPGFGPDANYISYVGRGQSADFREKAVNYYDKGVLQADQIIAKILEKLQQRGYMDDALVVITGDHGEGLGEHGRYTHARAADSVYEETLRVPFIVLAFGKADPGILQPSRVISQIDIPPTLLYALGIKIPGIWKGVPIQIPNQRRYIDFQEMQLIGLIDTQFPDFLYKHWIDSRSGESLTFDLLSDPGEKTDITSQIPEALRNEWREHLKMQPGALPKD